MDKNKIEDYWRAYQETLPPESPLLQNNYVAESFGDSLELADELAALILEGAKIATCSALWEWQADGDPIPEVGLITIVLDGRGKPLCIIETTEVKLLPYNEVDDHFAYEEDEGDRSLEYWRQANWNFFSRSLALLGKKPTEEMPLVCERFQVIHK